MRRISFFRYIIVTQGAAVFVTWKPQSDLIERLDPGFTHPAYDALLGECAAKLTPLSEFITHITYGAIVTGVSPENDPEGLPLIGQGALRHSGVDLSGCVKVPADSPWALERATAQRGDLLMARSGTGSLEKNRLAVYHLDEPAVVDCWVDLVRLGGIEPDFVAAFLKTRFGWAQIHRLTNGVGPANLSFDEIRSLRVPVGEHELEARIVERYGREVLPLHNSGRFDEATEAMRTIVRELTTALRVS